jgi:RNA polymerase sigma factor (TIGR02999 family)
MQKDESPLTSDIASLLERADAADGKAADALFAVLYRELHRLAEENLRSADSSLSLGATTLLHEAYLNIAGRENVAFPDRNRFLAYASRAMRGLVIDYARRCRATKRGRHLEITLGEGEAPTSEAVHTSAELERLDDALVELAALEPELAELVDLHFFCGYSFAEIAALRQVSDRTVQRDWRKARLLLHHALLE